MESSAADQLHANIEVPIEEIRAFCAKWKIDELAIFGSVLREDFRPDSDIDVLVTPGSETPRGFGPRMAMEDELTALFGRRADLTYKGGLVNPIRRRAILGSARILYAA
jgi:predicted nucleotidyltransferase